jgi:hypothetical protein
VFWVSFLIEGSSALNRNRVPVMDKMCVIMGVQHIETIDQNIIDQLMWIEGRKELVIWLKWIT